MKNLERLVKDYEYSEQWLKSHNITEEQCADIIKVEQDYNDAVEGVRERYNCSTHGDSYEMELQDEWDFYQRQLYLIDERLVGDEEEDDEEDYEMRILLGIRIKNRPGYVCPTVCMDNNKYTNMRDFLFSQIKHISTLAENDNLGDCIDANMVKGNLLYGDYIVQDHISGTMYCIVKGW